MPAEDLHIGPVFNEPKGGDPMSSDFVFRSVVPADCLSGEQPLL
jgi:hypothetical protein